MSDEHYTPEQIAAAAKRLSTADGYEGLSINSRSLQPKVDERILAWAYIAERESGAVATDLLAELRDTADWLAERAKMLRQLADQAPGVMRKRNEHLKALRDEAARFDGRAAVIRQTILKATQSG